MRMDLKRRSDPMISARLGRRGEEEVAYAYAYAVTHQHLTICPETEEGEARLDNNVCSTMYIVGST